ncbi:MAG: hypothetical protein IIC82_01355, partial [Chloroflexi bacterium]|nr:hypothetical protein [Chloroflexota bacterium]
MTLDTPVINHVALTVDNEVLQDGSKRESLKDFLTTVFGWEVIPQLTIDDKRLVFRMYRRGQFLYLVTGQKASECGPADHFGIEVGTLTEIERMVSAAKKYKEEKDSSVQIIDLKVNTETETLRLHNAYVRYLLPMMIEVQYYEEMTPA